MKVAAPAFIIPWLFLWNHNLLAKFGGLFPAMATLSATMFLIFSLQAGLFGQLFKGLDGWEQIAFIFVSVLLIAYVITQYVLLFVIGVPLFLAMLLTQIVKVKPSQALA